MRRTIVISLTLLALALGPACALASASDASTTASYVRANYALVASSHATQGAAEAALQSLLTHVRRDCPSVVAGSPQDEASEKLTAELIGVMRLVAVAPNVKAVVAYSRAVAGLRWSNGSLTRAVRTYAHELLAQSRLAVPDFCSELRAWKASGYSTLPPATVRFNRAYYAVYVGIGLLPTGQLAPSLGASERGLVQRTLQLENDVIEFEAQAVETWGKIMNAAGLQP